MYHPDVAKDRVDPNIFKEVLEAYDTLSSKDKRASYDLGLAHPAFNETGQASYQESSFKTEHSNNFYKNK